MLLDLLLWLPVKALKYSGVLDPVVAMLEDLAEGSEEAIKEYAEEHGILF